MRDAYHCIKEEKSQNGHTLDLLPSETNGNQQASLYPC